MADKISALKTLLTRLIDSRDGYADAMEHVTNPALKSTISDFHQRRVRNAEELRGYLARIGAEVDDDGSLLAAAHRTFMDLKDTVTGSDDAAVLAEIVRGEESLHSAYHDALEACGAADPEFAFLSEQHASLKEAIARIETRRDMAA